MGWNFTGKCLGVVFSALLALCGRADGLPLQMADLLPVSKDVLTFGEWNSNFGGGLAIADAYHVPLLVIFGGVTCGRCADLQRACLTDEFLAWQGTHKMLMVFVTDNSTGDASRFARPATSRGFPYVAVYWNRSGSAPTKNSEYYRTFNGLDGEMLVKGGSLAEQLIGSINSVVGEYDFSSLPDISARAEWLYQNPVLMKVSYDIDLFTGVDAAGALAPQAVYNLRGSAKPKIKKVSGRLPSGVKFRYVDGMVVLSGKAKSAEACTYSFLIQQKYNGLLYEGPEIVLSFNVVSANDASQGGCALLNRALKATVPLLSADAGDGAVAAVLELSVTARNRIRAKYTNLSRAKATFSGTWSAIDEGTAWTSLAATGKRLALELANDGRIKAVLTDPALSAPLESPDGLKVGVGSHAAAFAGAYAMDLSETSGDDADGGSINIKKITAVGKVSWNGTLGNGARISGTAFAMQDVDGCCIVPVFKVKAKDYLTAVLSISRGTPEGAQGKVAPYEGTKVVWK